MSERPKGSVIDQQTALEQGCRRVGTEHKTDSMKKGKRGTFL